ncbi:MAG: hypothetical protein WC538_21530 [Thermoanaerobaculia bacterium]|jgi:hypothetical protein
MCRRVECSECGKPGYAGCGKHVEQVLGEVQPENRCRCREERAERKAQNARQPSPWADRIRKLMG